MDKDKFNSQDIVDALSQHTACSKQQGDAFLKAFVQSIEEALLQKDTVKIKDFGIFKLNWIAARKSVNVHTAKPIVLDAYYKVVFTPESELKKLVNRPYAHLETVILDDDRNKKLDPLFSLSEQASEIKGLLSEIETMPNSAVPPAEELSPEEKKEETVKLEKELALNSEDRQPSGGKKNKNYLFLSLLLLFSFIFLAFLFFDKDDNSTLLSSNEPVLEVAEANVASQAKASVNSNTTGQDLAIDSALLVEPTFDDSQEELSDAAFAAVFESRLKNTELKDSVRLEQGQYLASLAKEYYGSAHFWVYIYEFNRNEIKNKNNLRSGMLIKIPKLDERLINLDDPRSLESAKTLEKAYE